MVALTTWPPRSGFASTAAAVLAFGAAFGYGEAAVVVYLRAALGQVPGVVEAHDPAAFGAFAAVEVARELATLVMIAAVAWIAGRTGLGRLAWAAVVFGTWDIVYYGALRVATGWPTSLGTWDILFLVPAPWVGPVWAPLAVSLALVVVGIAAARRLLAGGRLDVGPWRAAGALGGGALVILSFLLGSAPDPSGSWTLWPIFWLGMALAAAAAIAAFAVEKPSVE